MSEGNPFAWKCESWRARTCCCAAVHWMDDRLLTPPRQHAKVAQQARTMGNRRGATMACRIPRPERGTIDGASVELREVVKQALSHDAAAVILAHSVARHKMG